MNQCLSVLHVIPNNLKDAVAYARGHSDLSANAVAANLGGVAPSTLGRWIKQADAGEEIHRGSGNYLSDEPKRMPDFARNSGDTKDALEILKKSNQHSGRLTEELFSQTAKLEKHLKRKGKRRLNVSGGVLRILGVSRTGYYSFKQKESNVKPSRRDHIKQLILKIHFKSKRIYGAPRK